jgi:hypothetical protein
LGIFPKYSCKRLANEGYSEGLNFVLSISSAFAFLFADNFNKLRRTLVPPISAIKTGYFLSKNKNIKI